MAARRYPSQIARQAVLRTAVLTNASTREATAAAATAGDALISIEAGTIPGSGTPLAEKLAELETRLEAVEP